MPNLTKLTTVGHWELTSTTTLMQFHCSSWVFNVLLKGTSSQLADEKGEIITDLHSHSFPGSPGIPTGDLPVTSLPDISNSACRHAHLLESEKNIQMKCGMSTKPSSSLCVWKLANVPPSIKQQRDRESVQLLIFFHPVPPQETVAAANGAQQRLDSWWAEQTHMWCDLWLTSANLLQIPLSFLLHSNDPVLYPQPVHP